MLAQPLRQYDHQHQASSRFARPSRTPIESWVSSYSTIIAPTQADYEYTSNDLPSSDVSQGSIFDYDTHHNFNNLRIHVDTLYNSNQEPELMHSEQTVAPASWYPNGQLTPTSARTHYRESSLSSIGSTGPASPYNGATPHPHVLLPSDSESNYDGLPAIDQASIYNFSKPLTPLTPSHTPSQDNFLVPPLQQNYNAPSYHTNSHIAALMAMQRQQASGDDESMSASDYGHSGRPSVASTHDSPATPPVAGEYEDQNRKNSETTSLFMEEWPDEYLPLDITDFRSVPKLDRTMSDIYNDELYSPSFTFTSAPLVKTEAMPSMPPMPHPHQSAVFSQMLQAANKQHLSASSRSPLGDQGRDQKTAFREGSPLAPLSNSFSSPQMRFGSAQQIRERQKAENDDRILQQIQRTSPVQTAPKTISPRDALLDYHGTEKESSMPLFPPQKSPGYRLQAIPVEGNGPDDMEETTSQRSFGSISISRSESSLTYSASSQTTPQPGTGFSFAPPSIPGGIRVPQQYPFVPQQRRQSSNISNLTDRSPEFLSALSSMEPGCGEYKPDNSDLKKPAGSNADGGTYTCTYHGCTLRFETPAKLQKHKREGHRQSAPLVGGTSTTAAASQAGPHKCTRINPSTGKPCNTVFSRPYDLTRHEDTIHNPRKMKVRCPLCKEEKTFSRSDALNRHLKIVHPSYQPPIKSKRGQQ